MKVNKWHLKAVAIASCIAFNGDTIAASLKDEYKSSSPYTGRSVEDDKLICLPSSSRTYFSIGDTNNVSSIAITTGYGSGNLILYTKSGG
ncbi:hypothetical protein [Pseudoalteromonas luteoviolacea]|uniref:Uncharacterized protein n=1 Tax=Pseudoalteromonas luteoviolacea NCIMB 1942 TaxID=1365253 RepID=A0A166ZUU9_9GAMM|nr:hypothetical protein [Pseudoalteromonas luteoviolacea]KZN44689.1 hypothetical protein N482_15980 [Pseudoalteromonas luteoviolacea NCIMB 1942]